MLSEETAIGRFPLEAVRTMESIARTIEPTIEYRHQFPQPGDEPTVGHAMSNAACDLAETLGAKAILVPTYTGRTASVVARLRPRRPVIGLSHHQHALQHMALEWGVTPAQMPEAADVEELWSASLEAGRTTGLIEEGDLVVLTAGTAVNIPGTTDMIKLSYA
jgi:pyruvate kinase